MAPKCPNRLSTALPFLTDRLGDCFRRDGKTGSVGHQGAALMDEVHNDPTLRLRNDFASANLAVLETPVHLVAGSQPRSLANLLRNGCLALFAYGRCIHSATSHQKAGVSSPETRTTDGRAHLSF